MVLNERNLMIALQSEQTIKTLSALFRTATKARIYKLIWLLRAEGKI